MITTSHAVAAVFDSASWSAPLSKRSADAEALAAALPLPPATSVTRAGYVGGMREIVAYDIGSDEYKVRYDWIGKSGAKITYFAEPIRPQDVVPYVSCVDEFAPVLAERRRACMKDREGQK